MMYMWSMSSLLYYFMSYYLIYLPGNTYTNTYASGVAELFATMFGGVLIKHVSTRNGFLISTCIAFLGGLMIMFLENVDEALMPVYVIFAKFGISSAYTLVYAVTIDLFPTLFAATAYGSCQLTCNILTVIAPYLAAMRAPYPMLVYNVMCVGGLIVSFLIKKTV